MLVAVLYGRELCGETPDYAFKARQLYNLSEFTEWPSDTFAGTNSPFMIGVLGKDPFARDLEYLVRDRKVNDRPIMIQHFRRSIEITNCQILFISASESKHLRQLLAELRGRSILTVSDMRDFVQRGGMVELSSGTDPIQFRINLDELKAAGLTMSSKLLRAAEIASTAKK